MEAIPQHRRPSGMGEGSTAADGIGLEGGSMAIPQCVFGGSSPLVWPSSRIVWSRIPLRTAALTPLTVASNASGSSARRAARPRIRAAVIGGQREV
jgi:hypothetical protein